VKHITYRWMNGAVGYNKEMQLPQFEIKGFRVVTKLEKLSTGTVETIMFTLAMSNWSSKSLYTTVTCKWRLWFVDFCIYGLFTSLTLTCTDAFVIQVIFTWRPKLLKKRKLL